MEEAKGLTYLQCQPIFDQFVSNCTKRRQKDRIQ